MLVCLLPDICFTPKKPGYPDSLPDHAHDGPERSLLAECLLSRQGGVLHNESFVDNVKGDEPGKVKGRREPDPHEDQPPIRHSRDVYVNGKAIVRTADQVWMNWKKP